ncbi:MAG: class I SAM-dependent methyltransferase [Bacteroidetes bacterium]|nr:class I SAM-dependent methyltransferase [Bacteroidota bacterium]
MLISYGNELIEVNQRVNLVSRKDADQVFHRHIGHCLAMAHRGLLPGTELVDWGTGGGLPAVVLAILFPEVRIVAVDATQKKIRALEHFIAHLGLTNIRAWNGRAEEYPDRFNLSVSRATAPLGTLWEWHSRKALKPRSAPQGSWDDGLLCLKGGDLQEEIAAMRNTYRNVRVEQIPLKGMTDDLYFETKALIHVSRNT